MDFALYSSCIIFGYAGAKWATPKIPSIKTEKYHLHHWIWGAFLLLLLLTYNVAIIGYNYIEIPISGILTGIILQGLSYRNWGFKR